MKGADVDSFTSYSGLVLCSDAVGNPLWLQCIACKNSYIKIMARKWKDIPDIGQNTDSLASLSIWDGGRHAGGGFGPSHSGGTRCGKSFWGQFCPDRAVLWYCTVTLIISLGRATKPFWGQFCPDNSDNNKIDNIIWSGGSTDKEHVPLIIQLLEYPILPSRKMCHKKAGLPRKLIFRLTLRSGAAKF